LESLDLVRPKISYCSLQPSHTDVQLVTITIILTMTSHASHLSSITWLIGLVNFILQQQHYEHNLRFGNQNLVYSQSENKILADSNYAAVNLNGSLF